MAAIALSRRLIELEQNIRQGGLWGGPIGRGLTGRTAGILGLGGIGQALAVRLRPFGMRLVGLSRRPDASIANRLGLEWIGGEGDLAEFLGRSEYLFLCVPLRPATQGMIGAREIALLPSGACIVNAARGGLIDTEALIDGLGRGHLWGAALDVFATEPLDTHSALLSTPGLIATPHIAGVTDVSYRDIARRVADNILRLYSNSPLENRVV
jgi:phosphoglycerate dehydrogenase-like enzyme